MKRNPLTAALLWALLLTACQQNTADTPPDNHLTFDTLTVNRQYHLHGNPANPHCTLEATFIHPSGYSDPHILHKINQHFLTTFFGEEAATTSPREAMKNYANRYLADYRELENDFPQTAGNTPTGNLPETILNFRETLTNEIRYNNHHLLSYSVTVEYYTGGAHGDHTHNHYLLCLKTGNRLQEQDIFTANYHDPLARLLLQTIADDHNLADPRELESLGYFNIREIYPTTKFLVDAGGITYTFNTSEIAARAVGKTDVTLPYARIRHLLRRDTPVYTLTTTEK
jgi:hypothetical protein